MEKGTRIPSYHQRVCVEKTPFRPIVLTVAFHSRWERSRASAITYSPLTGQISDIRLLSETGLLASSIHHGIVSRSNPLSGKVFRGFLDAAGTLNGLGMGNPNAEFSPNVCLCRIFTERSTAKILWGFTHGEMAVTTANKVVDPSRTSAAKFSRSRISEQHSGTVVDAVWGEGGDVFLTAGVDGKVKLWDAVKMRCLWTSPMRQNDPFPTSYPSHLNLDGQKGIAAAAFSDGDVFIWCGLSPLYAGDDVPQDKEVIIPHISLPLFSTTVSHLVLDTTDGTSLLVHRLDSVYFRRHNINFATGEVETIEFGGESNRLIMSLKLVTAAQAKAVPFVLVGDSQGSLTVYDWNTTQVSNEGTVPPARRISAFSDEVAVSSIEWNPWVLATGSTMGTVKVWDSLKFSLLHTFLPPTRGHDGHPSIALEREMIVIALGDKITTWRAGPVRKGNKVIRASRKGKNNALAKWRRELYGLIEFSDGYSQIHRRTSGYVPRHLRISTRDRRRTKSEAIRLRSRDGSTRFTRNLGIERAGSLGLCADAESRRRGTTEHPLRESAYPSVFHSIPPASLFIKHQSPGLPSVETRNLVRRDYQVIYLSGDAPINVGRFRSFR